MDKQKIDFRLEAVKGSSATKVYLYGDIVDERPIDWWTGEELQGDYITPKEVRELFDSIESDNIDLHLNSYGGSVFASVSIFNYLQNLNKNITTYNDGLCASGASLIFMAGKERVMPKNTVLMIHRASSFTFGNCNDLRVMADTLEKLDNSTVYETYRAHFTGDSEELLNIINAETWITADESLEYGLCTSVMEINSSDEGEKSTDELLNQGRKLMMNFANLKTKGEMKHV